MVIQRLGFGAVLNQAFRDSLPEWYERAMLDSGVSPIGDPQHRDGLDARGGGRAAQFKFEVGVLPPAKLGEYKGLEVGRAETEVPDELVDRELERLREGFARLEPVERAAAEGDSC